MLNYISLSICPLLSEAEMSSCLIFFMRISLNHFTQYTLSVLINDIVYSPPHIQLLNTKVSLLKTKHGKDLRVLRSLNFILNRQCLGNKIKHESIQLEVARVVSGAIKLFNSEKILCDPWIGLATFKAMLNRNQTNSSKFYNLGSRKVETVDHYLLHCQTYIPTTLPIGFTFPSNSSKSLTRKRPQSI